jgi:hypothetical protein
MVELLTWVTVTGGGTSQYAEDVTVSVLVLVFGGGGGGGGGAPYPADLVTSFVEVKVTVTVFGGFAPYPGGDVTVLVDVRYIVLTALQVLLGWPYPSPCAWKASPVPSGSEEGGDGVA